MIMTQKTQFAWDFVFLGANQDAFAVAEGLGIARGMAMNYAASAQGASAAVGGLSARVASYRGTKGAAALENLQASYDAEVKRTSLSESPER
jgi:hypothetical protein